MEHLFQVVYGVRVHYVRAGTGPPLVLLHGLGASWITWSLNIEPLARHYTVYAPDIPGHGDSDKLEIDYSVRTGAPFFLGWLDALGIEQAAFIGNSVGGLLSLRIAQDAPQRASHLVLVSSAGLGKELSRFLRLSSLPLVGELFHIPKVITIKGLLKSIFYQPRDIDASILEELKRVRNLRGANQAVLKSIRNSAGLGGLRDDLIFTRALDSLAMPVMAVWGEQDRIIPVQHAYRIRRECPRVRVEVFPRCGHWPHMEKAERFNPLLLEFLKTPMPEEAGD